MDLAHIPPPAKDDASLEDSLEDLNKLDVSKSVESADRTDSKSELRSELNQTSFEPTITVVSDEACATPF